MSSQPLVATLALAFVLSSAAGAQGFKEAPLPQVGTQPASTPQFGPGNVAAAVGTGAFGVWVGEPQNNQSFSLGTAVSLAFQNDSGVAVQPASGIAGTVRVTFAPNNTMVLNAVRQSCYGQRNCAGPGWPVLVITQNLPGGAVTHYTGQGASIVSVTAPLNGGGGVGVFAFQRLFVQTTTPDAPSPPPSQTGRVNAQQSNGGA